MWDVIDHTLFHKVGQWFDLAYSDRYLGVKVGLPKRQADNVNSLDEAVNSSWFTNRHFITRMSHEMLAIGPDEDGPVTIGL